MSNAEQHRLAVEDVKAALQKIAEAREQGKRLTKSDASVAVGRNSAFLSSFAHFHATEFRECCEAVGVPFGDVFADADRALARIAREGGSMGDASFWVGRARSFLSNFRADHKREFEALCRKHGLDANRRTLLDGGPSVKVRKRLEEVALIVASGVGPVEAARRFGLSDSVIWDQIRKYSETFEAMKQEARKRLRIPPGARQVAYLVSEETGAVVRTNRDGTLAVNKARQKGRARGIPSTQIPRWNRKKGRLTLYGKTIRKVRVTHARALVRVLDAFEEEGWPETVENPLPPTIDMGDIVKSLNDGLTRIRFGRQAGHLFYWTCKNSENS